MPELKLRLTVDEHEAFIKASRAERLTLAGWARRTLWFAAKEALPEPAKPTGRPKHQPPDMPLRQFRDEGRYLPKAEFLRQYDHSGNIGMDLLWDHEIQHNERS